jgi:hypothetical protein
LCWGGGLWVLGFDDFEFAMLVIDMFKETSDRILPVLLLSVLHLEKVRSLRIRLCDWKRERTLRMKVR